MFSSIIKKEKSLKVVINFQDPNCSQGLPPMGVPPASVQDFLSLLMQGIPAAWTVGLKILHCTSVGLPQVKIPVVHNIIQVRCVLPFTLYN